MIDWYTQILPLVLGPPIIIGAFILWHVVPAWFSSLEDDKNASR